MAKLIAKGVVDQLSLISNSISCFVRWNIWCSMRVPVSNESCLRRGNSPKKRNVAPTHAQDFYSPLSLAAAIITSIPRAEGSGF